MGKESACRRAGDSGLKPGSGRSKHCLMALSVLTASNIITSEIKKERSSFVKKILAVKSTWSRAPFPTQCSDGYHPYLPLLLSYFYTSYY